MTERDNSQKLAPQVQASPASETNNDPFSFLRETYIVDLPSGGKYYQDPLLKKGQLELLCMTAVHEDILANQNYIKKGVVFDKFIDAITVDNIDPSKLLLADRAAIMHAARSAAYGSTFIANMQCSSCGHKNKVEVDLSDARHSQGIGRTDDGSHVTSDGKIKIRLPKCSEKAKRDYFVTLRMMDGELESVVNRVMKRGTNLDGLAAMITEVDGLVETAQINTFVRVLPAEDSAYINQMVSKLVPSNRLFHDFVCEECGHEEEGKEVGLSVNFFRPEL